ncbi:MAG: LD-carboxypeptidase [Deltaproteobacteria bacterium]|nr:LD-carboxypeptidase [Deltaproteobacteria bacterium]
MALLPLSPGARIGVFGPSGIHDPERLLASLEIVRGWGFDPVLAPHLGRRWRYLGGTDEERRADLEWALGDSSLDAAWLARGGYGILRLLPHVRWDRVVPRPVVGFSDATALFQAMHRRRIAGAIHGPVLHSLVDHADGTSRDAVRRLLLEGVAGPWRGTVLVAGRARGPLVGGNLCTLGSLAGTPDAIRARGCILLLEEVAEAPYRVDRLLAQLVASGALDGVKGVALGSFVECEAPAGEGWSLMDVVLDHLGPLGVPVVVDLPVGHGGRNCAFVHGAEAVLEEGVLAFAAHP